MRFCPECKAHYGLDLVRCPKDGAPLLNAPEPDAKPLERSALQRLQPLEADQSRYTIIAKIGQGGWGGVYRAYQHSTRREVALKVLRQEVAHDDLARRRFHREAEAVSQLKHPNTVTIFDFGETNDGLLFIAMEFIDGVTLDDAIQQKGSLPPLQAIRIARQIALSLAEAHEKGIVHRDVKPHNIMLTRFDEGDDFVKVLDFGVAKLVAVESNLTTTGATFGTPEYMSPEQVQSKDIDARSDLYALGIILYQMLAGLPPFTGKSAVTVALSHVRKRPPAIRNRKDLPKALRSLVWRLLSKSPGDRPQTARAVATELEAVERRLLAEVGVPGPHPLERLANALTSGWMAGLSVLAVACLVVVMVVLLRGKAMVGEGPASSARSEQPSRPVLKLISPDIGGGWEGAGRGPDLLGQDLAGRPSPVVVEDVAARLDVLQGEGEGPSGLDRFADPGELVAQPETVLPEDVDIVVPIDLAPEVLGGSADTAEVAALTVQRIDANVAGADIMIGGKMVCETPCDLSGKPGERLRIRVVKRGYVTDKRKFTFAQDAQPLYIELRKVSLSETDGLKVAPTPAEEDGLK